MVRQKQYHGSRSRNTPRQLSIAFNLRQGGLSLAKSIDAVPGLNMSKQGFAKRCARGAARLWGWGGVGGGERARSEGLPTLTPGSGPVLKNGPFGGGFPKWNGLIFSLALCLFPAKNRAFRLDFCIGRPTIYVACIKIKTIYEGNGRIPCPDGIEVLYLPFLDSEYITLNTLKFCIWPYE